MEKVEFREQVKKNLQLEMKRRHISQMQLLKKCKELGYHLTQPELSKLLSGKTPITLYQMTAFASALDTSVEQLVSGAKRSERLLNIGGKSFVSDPKDEVYNGYLGTYFTILHSTSPFEDRWLSGKLTLSASKEMDGYCKASFELDTGEKDKKGHSLIKLYEGEILISPYLGVAYCVLVNELIGELSVIEFRHRSFFVKEVECRIGLVLTTSAGENKLPLTQKIFMARKQITEELAQAILPFLKFTLDEIPLTKEQLEELCIMYPEIEFVPMKDRGREVQYCLLSEKTLRGRATSVTREKRAALIRAVRDCAAASWSYSVTEREDSLAYETEKRFDAL